MFAHVSLYLYDVFIDVCAQIQHEDHVTCACEV